MDGQITGQALPASAQVQTNSELNSTDYVFSFLPVDKGSCRDAGINFNSSAHPLR